MARSDTRNFAAVVAILAIGLALIMFAPPSAEAAKPLPIASASATHNADCSVDVEFTLNSKGRQVVAISVAYVQDVSNARGAYANVTALSRGQTVKRNIPFVDAANGMGDGYHVTYTAFAKNGTVLAQSGLGFFDNSACTG